MSTSQVTLENDARVTLENDARVTLKNDARANYLAATHIKLFS